ncbi:hypothetical protein BS78_01G230000 [Paspalum vaginatum]|nr:hypothetical protein BS78_01G230000 [Paspalum vaginatum]
MSGEDPWNKELGVVNLLVPEPQGIVRFGACVTSHPVCCFGARACSFDVACLNLSMQPPKAIPNICAVVNCGAGGVCKAGSSGLFSYSCECQPGYTNLIYNKTALPCAKNCFFGNCCSALGPGTPAPAPAPSSCNQSSPPGPSSPSAPPPPSGTKGSASSPSLLPLVLLLSITAAQVM